MFKMPRVLLAAGASGSGKTFLTCGILQALLNRGIRPVSFKCGPDFIDPMFHTRVLGTRSTNLDTFFTDDQTTRYLFGVSAQGADLAVIEGVMGFYDGLGGVSERASTYDVARVTDTSVVLVVNCKGMSLSLLPYIKGFLEYKKDSRIRAVILNRLPSALYPVLGSRIREELGITPLGYVPEIRDFTLESRHLGLVLPEEIPQIRDKLCRFAAVLEETLDLDGLLTLAGEASGIRTEEPADVREVIRRAQGYTEGKEVERDPAVTEGKGEERDPAVTEGKGEERDPAVIEGKGEERDPVVTEGKEEKRYPVIAVAKDEAFCFIYEDNLRLLRDMGARIAFFSPLRDEELPECDGLILYGGYPELHARMLSQNTPMLRAVRRAVLSEKKPCLAECGGFMYLQREMEDMNGQFYPMTGVLSGKAFRTQKLVRFGYVTLMPESKACAALPVRRGEEAGAGETTGGEESERITVKEQDSLWIRGHEFHYYDTTDNGDDYEARKPVGKRSWACMHASPSLLAGFPHLYYYSNPRAALRFFKACADYRKSRPDPDRPEPDVISCHRRCPV